ncbi:MAG: type II toxin-antitoxin system RelE/ParE family toxin [Gammaproteobacteria bacterium]|nr:type II toxin-antitoxin system RelE/ParE family toxin [Gammaproteobacteria bacterium]
MKYQLTVEAAKDVEEILAYSVNSFGAAQTEHYFVALKECIGLLADNPGIGHNAEDLLPDYFRFPYESHVIFYKRLSTSILVVRILHERMDPKLHIKK